MKIQQRFWLSLLVVAISSAAAGSALAVQFTFKTISYPGASEIVANAVNDRDQVVGAGYVGSNVGFVWSKGTVTLVDGTQALEAINNAGLAVGEQSNSTPNFALYNIATGDLNFIPVPGVMKGGSVGAYAINASGEVVGTAVDKGGFKSHSKGFVMISGVVENRTPGNHGQAYINSLNNKGDFVFNSGTNYYDPLLYHDSNIKLKRIAVPGAATTNVGFITNDGIIGGTYTPSGTSTTVGFVKIKGVYETVSPSNAVYSVVTGVGPDGQIVGWFDDTAARHGFVYSGGTYYQIDVPGSVYTEINAINSKGSIVGLYFSKNDSGVGFIATCPTGVVCTQ